MSEGLPSEACVNFTNEASDDSAYAARTVGRSAVLKARKGRVHRLSSGDLRPRSTGRLLNVIEASEAEKVATHPILQSCDMDNREVLRTSFGKM